MNISNENNEGIGLNVSRCFYSEYSYFFAKLIINISIYTLHIVEVDAGKKSETAKVVDIKPMLKAG